MQVLILQITRFVIDDIIPHQRFNLIPWIGVAIALTSLLQGGLNFVRTYLMSLVGQQTIYDVRNELYQHLQSLSMSFFEN